MKKVAAIIVAFGALIAVALVLMSSLAVYSKRERTALLAKPPEHGTAFIIEADRSQIHGSTNTSANLKAVLKRRFDKFGAGIYWEPVSETRVRIAVPVTDPKAAAQARELVSHGGHLEFRLVHEQSDQLVLGGEIPAGYALLQQQEVEPDGRTNMTKVVVKTNSEAGLAGDLIKSAMVTHGQSGLPQIDFQLNQRSKTAFAELTRTNLGHRLAIVLDGRLYSAPVIESPIESGSGQITGRFEQREAWVLTTLMEYPLPVPVTLVEVKTF